METESKIVHTNYLVEASYNLTINELRIIMIACSKLDSRKPYSGEMVVTLSEFTNVFGFKFDGGRTYSDLVYSAKKLIRSPIVVYDKSKKEEVEINWLTKNRYKPVKNGRSITVNFTPDIVKHLTKIKKNFTALNLEYASKLNAPFAFRLYQWLVRFRNFNSNKRGDATVVNLSVEWMKDRAGMQEKYKNWQDFRRWVLEPSVIRINDVTDIYVSHEYIREGRSVVSVEFSYITEKATISKPIRQRLARRPKVTKGSDAEGKWMMKNFNILLEYEKKLKNYDSSAKLTIDDLKKFIEYSKICAPEKHKILLNELTERTKK